MKITIIEGSQGTGKTTLTNYLRDNIPYSNLLRLTGIEDKNSPNKIFKIHEGVLDLIEKTKECDINYILDRSFLSEWVYAQLGHKNYDFNKQFDILLEKLNNIGKDIEIDIILLIANKETFERRLKRDKPNYSDVEFSVSESMKQQKKYFHKLWDIRSFLAGGINLRHINVDNINVSELAEEIMFPNKRKIIVRGKDKTIDEWEYFDFENLKNKNTENIKMETSGLYTGKRDIKGNMIFEGDILRETIINDLDYSKSEELLEVIWMNDGFGTKIICKQTKFITSEGLAFIGRFKPRMSFCTYCEYEVVGNIYDNPELLKI